MVCTMMLVLVVGESQRQLAGAKAAAKQHKPVSAATDMTGFGQCIGNGLFWLAPFILYFLPLSIGGFSLFDNGHLQDGFER